LSEETNGSAKFSVLDFTSLPLQPEKAAKFAVGVERSTGNVAARSLLIDKGKSDVGRRDAGKARYLR